jgi:hypothetical protein
MNLRDPRVVIFETLVATLLGAAYVLRIAPRTPRQWFLVALVLGLLAWLLPLMVDVRSR